MSTSDAVPGPCTSSTNEPSPSALPLPQPDPAQSIASESSGPKGKGEGKGKGRRREDESPDVKISKALSYILRHGAAKEGLKMRPDGYVRVDDILKRPKLKGVDVDTLRRIVAENNKQRYALSEEPASSPGPRDASTSTVLWIRANQGHSLAVDDLELVRIQNTSECPVVVHGTFSRHWEAIRSEGLKIMNRHHIHCASGLFGEEGVTSGMRASCDLFIYIDIAKALADGVVFERSANGVILTKGQNGTLEPKYFERVQNKKGETIWPEAQ